nr:uncharacterized protein LOC107443489 isoform X1 [Parasteatoda tepidariorum]XP_042898923.1 uncharacterized protein LOC107443489 isoform X1 [Parasteatoda tepidariorum]
MYENIAKFESGLNEVNGLLWEQISKIPHSLEIYTHHKIMLWWCFKNQPLNELSIYTLQTWLDFSVLHENAMLSSLSMKTVLQLLCFNDTARECFMRQFNVKPEASFSFLKKALQLEVKEIDISTEKFEEFISFIMQHLATSITKLLVVKNKSERKSYGSTRYLSATIQNEMIESLGTKLETHLLEQIRGSPFFAIIMDTTQDISKVDQLSIVVRFLKIGLECLVWNNENNYSISPDLKIKLTFHVMNFCCKESLESTSHLNVCLKFLRLSVTDAEVGSKAWHIITGNVNIPAFFVKCLFSNNQPEVEALHLILVILKLEFQANLKCSTHVTLSLTHILKWMNNSSMKLLSLEIIYQLLLMDLKSHFVKLASTEILSTKFSLQRNDFRLLAFSIENALMLGNPMIDNVALSSYTKLIEFIEKTDPSLVHHILLRPWLKILLESKLENIEKYWFLFEKCYSLNEENLTLITIFQQFAERIPSIYQELNKQKTKSIEKLYNGVYKKYIPTDLKQELRRIVNTADDSNSQSIPEKPIDIVSQVESIVNNYITNEM